MSRNVSIETLRVSVSASRFTLRKCTTAGSGRIFVDACQIRQPNMYCQRLLYYTVSGFGCFEQTQGTRATILSELAGKNEDGGHDVVAVDDGVLFYF